MNVMNVYSGYHISSYLFSLVPNNKGTGTRTNNFIILLEIYCAFFKKIFQI